MKLSKKAEFILILVTQTETLHSVSIEFHGTHSKKKSMVIYKNVVIVSD